jgi:adenine-specific DNA methylase
LEYRRKSLEILPTKLFAIQGFCWFCANEQENESHLKYSNYKFIKGISKQDINLFKHAERQWQQEKKQLLWPKGSIPIGSTTRTLQNHNYQQWEDMFNRRQKLALSTILNYINEIDDLSIQEMFLAAFINLLNHNNVFTRYSPKGKKVEGIFARHDFHVLTTYAENNVWGTKYGRGTWIKCLNRLLKGKQYNDSPYDSIHTVKSNGRKRMEKIYSGKINGKLKLGNFSNFPSKEENLLLLCQDSANISDLPIRADLIISDPPYADNVNYSELSDFFFVWIKLILANKYPHFKVEETPKVGEAIKSKDRSLDYYNKLTEIFKSTKAKLSSDGIFVFTFHHSDIQTWLKLFEVITNAGLRVVKTHSIPSEARNVLNIQKKKAIAFDLIIVCRINTSESLPTISLEKFKILIDKQYKKRLDMFAEAHIKISGLDWLAIFFGVFLENCSKFKVITSFGQAINIKEVHKACSDIIEAA